MVVPATNHPPTLSRCVAAIRSADDPPDELIVVDAPAELSAAGARNAGAASANSDVVVFVDADVEVHADAFRRIRAAFDREPDLSGVFGAYDDSPADTSIVSSFRNLLHHHVHHEGAGPVETFWTGLGAIRRSAFRAVGGFDEQRFPHPSVEDIELGERLHGAGYTIELDPTIQGTHLKTWTLRSMIHTDFFHRAIPWIEMQIRSRRLSSSLNLGWRHRLSALACVATVLTVAVRPLVAVMAMILLVTLNTRFYRLLALHQGSGAALVGIGLHIVHHLVAVAAIPFGIAAGLNPRRRYAREGMFVG